MRRALLKIILSLLLIDTSYGEPVAALLPIAAPQDRSVMVSCTDITTPISLIVQSTSGEKIAEHKITRTKPQTVVEPTSISNPVLQIEDLPKGSYCQGEIRVNDQIVSIIPFEQSSHHRSTFLAPQLTTEQTWTVAAINLADVDNEICFNSSCTILAPGVSKLENGIAEGLVSVTTRNDLPFAAVSFITIENQLAGILSRATECQNSCEEGLAAIQEASSAFDILLLKKDVIITEWDEAGIPLKQHHNEPENWSKTLHRSFKNRNRIFSISCESATPETPCAFIQSYYLSNGLFVQPRAMPIPPTHLDAVPIFHPPPGKIQTSLVLSPSGLLTLTGSGKLDISEMHQQWENTTVSSIRGVGIRATDSHSAPVLLPITYSLRSRNKPADLQPGGTTKQHQAPDDCTDEIKSIVRKAPPASRERLMQAQVLSNEAFSLESRGKISQAMEKYNQLLSILPIAQCPKDRLLTLNVATSKFNMTPLSQRMEQQGSLSLSGLLAAIYDSINHREFNLARKFINDYAQASKDDNGDILYLKTILDVLSGDTTNLADIKEKIEKSLQLTPDQVLPMLSLSRIARISGESARADELVEKAILLAQEKVFNSNDKNSTASGIKNTLPELYLQLGVALYEGSYKDRNLLVSARDAFNTCLFLEPDLLGADVYLASVNVDLHDEDTALFDSNTRGTNSSLRQWLLFQRTRAYIYSNRVEEAETEASEAEKANLPTAWVAWVRKTIKGENTDLSSSPLTLFPLTPLSAIPPQLIQFERDYPYPQKEFQLFARDLLNSNRSIRHEAAGRIATYFTDASRHLLEIFFEKYRSEITEDFLDDSKLSASYFMLQFVPKLETIEIERIRTLLGSNKLEHRQKGLFLVYHHGSQCSSLIEELRKMVFNISAHTPALELVKALGALKTPESEHMLLELASRHPSQALKIDILEVLKFASLTNSKVNDFLNKMAEQRKSVSLSREAQKVINFRKVREQMQTVYKEEGKDVGN